MLRLPACCVLDCCLFLPFEAQVTGLGDALLDWSKSRLKISRRFCMAESVAYSSQFFA